jgi:hypothetical protein
VEKKYKRGRRDQGGRHPQDMQIPPEARARAVGAGVLFGEPAGIARKEKPRMIEALCVLVLLRGVGLTFSVGSDAAICCRLDPVARFT